MNIELDDAILKLDQYRDLSIREADGDCIHVHWGRVWVTRSGDTRDHVINGGESIAIDRPGTTVLTAMIDAGISVMKRCTAADAKSAHAVAVQGNSEAGAAAAPKIFDRTLPDYGDIDRKLHHAHQLRAQAVSSLLRNMWAALGAAFADSLSRTPGRS